MSTTAAPNPDGRKKFKSRLSSFGPTSISPSRSPSNMQASLPELFALLTTQPKADEGECRCDVAENSTDQPSPGSFSNDDLLTTPERTTDKCDSQSSTDRVNISEGFECDIASDLVENRTSFVGEEEVIVREQPEPGAPIESDAVVRKGRKFLQEKVPAEKNDVPEALQCPTSSLSRLIVAFTPTAFLTQRPGFRVLHEDLYSFVYYQDLEDEDDECGFLSLIQHGATAGPCLASSIDYGPPYAAARTAELGAHV